MDIALPMCLGMRRIEDKHFIKLLCTLRAILEHGAHRGVAVDVSVFTFHIIFERGLEGQVFVHLHQSGVHFTHAGALIAIQNVLLRRAGMSAFDQNLLYCILYLLHRGNLISHDLFEHLFHLFSQTARHLGILPAGSLRRPENRTPQSCQVRRGLFVRRV